MRNLKAREERRRTVLRARIRNGGSWSDGCILNISASGLMVYTKCLAEPGSHVELRRGGQLVFARVVWRKNQRMGLHSADPLQIEEIISATTAYPSVAPSIGAQTIVERRKDQRDHDRSRARSRGMEFLSLVLIGTMLAFVVGVHVLETLGRPVAAVQAALNTR